MRKWLQGCLVMLFLAAMLSVPAGCGSGKTTDLKPTGKEPPPAAGHDTAVKDMGKKPEGETE